MTLDLNTLTIVKNAKGVDDPILALWQYITESRAGIEAAIAYGTLFWPSWVEKDGLIFLAANYEESYYHDVHSQFPGQEEQIINLTYLEGVIAPVSDEIDTIEAWEALASVLCRSWIASARESFPHRVFSAEYEWHSDGDYLGVTVFQQR